MIYYLTLSTAPVGITSYAVSDYDTVLFVKNNNPFTIVLTKIELDDRLCLPLSPTIIFSGIEKKITCGSISQHQEKVISYSLLIEYTDKETGAEYRQEDSQFILSSDVSTKYLSQLSANQYWGMEQNGCWNTTVTPHPLCTCVDLDKVKTNSTTLSWDYEVQNHIDFNRCDDWFGSDYVTGTGWTPIGNWTDPFIGNFDGNNNVITGLFINRNSPNQGLFGSVYDPAIIRDMSLASVDITGGYYVGGLAGEGYTANIHNSYISGTVSGTNGVGGLVGYGSYGEITNSYSFVSVNGTVDVGGLLGVGISANVTGSYSTGSVVGTDDVGGLVGIGDLARIISSHATGNVVGNSHVGSLVGVGDSISVMESYATGSVSGTSYVGGLVGDAVTGMISNSYATGLVSCTTQYCGGLIGYYTAGSITGKNTWINNSDDASGCIGQPGTTAGTGIANCSP